MRYTFENTSTGETYVEEMLMDDREKYLADHPEVTQIITSSQPTLDPVKLGITKPDSTFRKYVLGRIQESVPGAPKGNFEKRWSIPKEI
tara:strand:+ start:397 stop:663 length:267 start_codon:yes stop_codon:yes gene_type:complete